MTVTVTATRAVLRDELRSGDGRRGGCCIRNARAHADGGQRQPGRKEGSCCNCFQIDHSRNLLSIFPTVQDAEHRLARPAGQRGC